MANITVTEILGTDSMNNSRVTINNNFKTLAQAIDTLNSVVTPSEIGNVQSVALKGSSVTVGSNNEIIINSNGIHMGAGVLDEELLTTIIEFFNNNGTGN